MGIVDPDFALQKLRQFRDLQESANRYPMGEVPLALETAISKLEPYVEDVARSLGEKRVADVAGYSYSAMAVANRLIGRLEDADAWERTFGPSGPTLAASGLHPWVWNAVASLWDDGHYEPAVHEAAKAVELRTQLKVDRRGLDGKDLYAHAFSTKNPKLGEPRLRFPDIDKDEQLKRWTSAHEGARNLGMGCAQGIRNPQAHPSPDITEQEALEQLAALSVLARWVDECDVDRADGDAAGQ